MNYALMHYSGRHWQEGADIFTGEDAVERATYHAAQLALRQFLEYAASGQGEHRTWGQEELKEALELFKDGEYDELTRWMGERFDVFIWVEPQPFVNPDENLDTSLIDLVEDAQNLLAQIV